MRRRKLAVVAIVVAMASLLMVGTSYARSLSAQGPDEAAPTVGCGGAVMGDIHTTMWNSLAQALGFSTEQLDKAIAGGKSLEQLAAEKGLSKEQLLEKTLAGMQAAVDQQVAKGTLSKEQANSIMDGVKKHMTLDHVASMGGTSGPMHGNGGMGSMHGATPGADNTTGGSCHGNDSTDGGASDYVAPTRVQQF
jgi:hypothetical protein